MPTTKQPQNPNQRPNTQEKGRRAQRQQGQNQKPDMKENQNNPNQPR
jgi:hypothetical protein